MTSTILSGAAEGNLQLVTGVPQRVDESIHWRKLMTDVILKKWSSWSPSRRTKQAEDGLGIEGAPRYFYAMRTERAFGMVVFLFRENCDVEWPQDAYGATPFDTGGLWHEKIHTSHSSKLSSMMAIFQNYHIPLISWDEAFKDYIVSNYDSICEYVKGDPPKKGANPIISGPPNSPRAWTWEVRIPCDLANRHVDLLSGFMSEEDRNTYLDWLWNDSDLDDRYCMDVDMWMRGKMKFSPSGILPSKMAEEELLGVKVS